MPTTLKAALQHATDTLLAAAVSSPQREALILVAWAAGVSSAVALAYPERELEPTQAQRLSEALARRARREPLAYITGRTEFWGLEIAVDRRVLVPRPETEHLVEQALALARRGAGRVIADIGTGSGCIAVALAHSLPDSVVFATDASPDALAVAAANVARHHLRDRVRLLQGDLLAPLPRPVHIICSNPPYIAGGEFAELMPEVRDYEPRAALDGGEDGLAVVRRLIQAAPAHLLAQGALVMEIGFSQGAAALELARAVFRVARIERDLAGLDRVLVAEM